MVELANTGSTAAQTALHYSTIRTLIPVIGDPGAGLEEDFCTCIKQCIPALPMFTDEVGTSDYKNDWYRMFQNTLSGGSHTLTMYVNGVPETVTDSTYGSEINGITFYGYQFNAYDIWDTKGYCEVYFVMNALDSLGNIIKTTTSPTFQIKRYTDSAANGTVVIESFQNGQLRHGNNYTDLRYSLPFFNSVLPNWHQRIRLPGKLKWAGAPIQLSGVVVNDSVHSRLQSLDTMDLEYDLELYLLGSTQANPVIFDFMFGNTVLVTDYNVYNYESYVKVSLLRTGIELSPRVRRRKSFVFKMVNADKKYEKFND